MKRVVTLFLSIFFMALGISLVVRANLGTTAVTSLPLVVSMLVPYTFGEVTMFINILLVVLQIFIARREFPLLQYFQILVSITLGLAIDFWSNVVSSLVLNHYALQLMTTILGCLVISMSIIMQLEANLVTNPTEGLVKVLALKFNLDFSKVKMRFDMSLVVIAIILSWVTLGKIVGVREGTLVSAVLVGFFMRIIQSIKSNYQLKIKES